ncbi:MAG: methyltransferase domain-containing protein [Patescibacteria group bacterium]
MSNSRSGPALSEQVEALGRLPVDFAEVDCLPPEIKKLIADPVTWSDPRVRGYTTTKSTIAHILAENPASDRMLQIVYPDTNGSPLVNGLDRFLSRSLSGQALRDRLDFCSDWLADNFARRGKRIIDLGGGSGSYAFRVFRVHGLIPAKFVWDILDLDLEALNVARMRAHDTGLDGVIQVRQGNFKHDSAILPEKADYAVLIGVLCGMDKDTARDVLCRAKDHLKPGGEMLAATLLQKAFDEDPRTFRILCNVGGWQLRPKTPEQVAEIFQLAGWEIIGDMMSERPDTKVGGGQYAIVHARAL